MMPTKNKKAIRRPTHWAAVILGGAFLYMAWQLLRTKGEGPWASITFHYSLLYLALLFVALAVDAAA